MGKCNTILSVYTMLEECWTHRSNDVPRSIVDKLTKFEVSIFSEYRDIIEVFVRHRR